LLINLSQYTLAGFCFYSFFTAICDSSGHWFAPWRWADCSNGL